MAISDMFKRKKKPVLHDAESVVGIPARTKMSVNTAVREPSVGGQFKQPKTLLSQNMDTTIKTVQRGAAANNHGIQNAGFDNEHGGIANNHGIQNAGFDNEHGGIANNHGIQNAGYDGLFTSQSSSEEADPNTQPTTNPLAGTQYEQYYDVYQGLLNALSVPTLSGASWDIEGLYDMLQTMLRPAVEQAIAQRNSQSQANIAALETDAYSRGMGGSTYLSSMHGRELSAAQSDIADIESNYASAIAKQLYSAMQQQYNQQLEIEMFNIEQQAQAQSDALDYWWDFVTSQQSQTQSGNGGYVGGNTTDEVPQSRFDYYVQFLNGFSSNVLNDIFFSESAHWQDIRNEMIAELGLEGYYALYEQYFNDVGGYPNPAGYGRIIGGVTHWVN